MYDLIIKNGSVIDFDNNKRMLTDVGIKDGKIIDVGRCTESSLETIDAEGLVVSPGFIDIHMHEEKIGESQDGDDFDIANYMLNMGVTTGVGGNCGINGQSLSDFFKFVNHNGAPINYLMFTGHNFLRDKLNIGLNELASSYQINQMKEMLRKDIENGSIGISFGIEYSPGITTEEIVEISRAIDKEILLSAHYRADFNYALKSVDELIQVSRHTKLPMQISHIGSCSAYGYMDESLKMIQEARDNNTNITADCYPYDAYSTYIGSEALSEENVVKFNNSYSNIMLTEGPYKGMYCDKDLYRKVRKEHPDMLAVAFVMNEDEIIQAYKSPFVFVASDGILNKGQGHPRAAGTFPRVLGKFVRQDNQLDFIDALKKMTLLPAKRLGLDNKGDIKQGMDADITIFDPDTIIDKASFDNPTLAPIGIEHVIIDGKLALNKGVLLNRRLGKALVPSK